MSAHPEDDRASLPAPAVREVAAGVYAYIQPDGTWWINNTGFVVADDGVVLIDTCSTEGRTEAFLGAVAAVTTAPLRLLVNTHHHGDHTHGNSLTHPAAIVAHDRCRDLVIQSGILHAPGIWEDVDWGDLTVSPPMVTFPDRLTVWAGDMRIELLHPGWPAHTTNDVVAWLPEQGVLFTGDLVFNGGTPFVMQGSLAGAIDSVRWLRSFGADVIVPGHGEVCTPTVLDRIERYYDFVDSLAAEAAQSGSSAFEAAAQADLGEFSSLTDSERLAGNLHRALAERSGLEAGGTIDVGAAIGDMIRLNGGRPLRCLA